MTGRNGNDQGGAPANEPKVAPGSSGTPTQCQDKVSPIWKFMEGMGRIGVAIVVSLVPIGLVYLFLRPKPESFEEPTVVVWRWLQNLPTEPTFYYSIAAIVGAYFGRRWWLSAKLRKEFERAKKENEYKSSLISRDWWVVQGLRERAVALRVKADWSLGCIFLLLFMGIYFVIFVVPYIEIEDQIVIERKYEKELNSILDLIFEGRYWLKIPENLSEDDEQKFVGKMIDSQIDVKMTEKISRLKMENIEKGWSLSENWISPDLSLEREEQIAAVRFSADGETGVVSGNKGSVFLTRDGGGSWSRPDLSLERGEWVTQAAFSADGGTGVVAGDEGSVFLTRDGGGSWSRPDLSLERGERITVAAFSADGETGVVSGNKGSVFLTRDGGGSWSRPDLSLERGEWVTQAAFSADGGTGVVAGDEGSVFLTRDGGGSWRPPDLSLEPGEWVTQAAFSADGGTGVVAGDKGSVFLTRDGGGSWRPPDLSLEPGEWVTQAAFSADGGIGMVAGNKGSVLLTRDGGKNWSLPDLSLEPGEWITAVTFSADGNAGMVHRVTTSVFLKRDDVENWSPSNLFFGRGERITVAAFSKNDNTGVVASNKGSIFLTRDGGKSWNPPDLSLEPGEWVTQAAFSADGRTGVMAGDEGSVFLTRNGGENWESTKGENLRSRDSFSSVTLTTEDAYVAETSSGIRYLLKNYKFSERPESLVNIRKVMENDAILRNSRIYKQISAFLYETKSIRTGDNSGGSSNVRSGWSSDFLEGVMGMRIVALFALFFLVHVLVRLHQYSLRLSAFWDARADAVLLAQSFAYRRAETFDDLVAALAPDAYDFKPTPKSGHEAVMNLAGQLLRRESRKS